MLRFILFCALTVLLSSCNPAFFNTIVYNDPGINDYKILPTRKVKADKPILLPRAASYNTLTLPDSLAWSLKKTRTIGFMVMKHDSIVYEWYAKKYSDSSHTNPFSATKAVVGVLTGIALRDGKIKSLDESVGDFLPEYAKDEKRNITFRHLLTMSSGVDYYDQYFNPIGPLAHLYYGNNVTKLINSFKAEKQPGTEWRYKNCDPEILTLALQKAVGMNMSEYASEKLWKPMGAEHDALWTIDKKNETGVEKSYCCLYSNVRDLAKVGLLYKHQGVADGKQLVDSAYVKDAITPVMIPNAERGGKPQNHYGYLWWLRNVDGVGDFSMEGMRGQYIIVIPKEDIVIVRLGVKEWYKTSERFKQPTLYPTIVRSVLGVWGEKRK
jgi:CubicO group peptidase (beta-lactamase class C family)